MKLFLSAPLTQYLAMPGRTTLDDFRTEWTRLTEVLEAAGHDVFSAHRRESWGADLDLPGPALSADLAGLDESDLVIAYVGSPPSPGVQLELGYAVARQKSLVVFVDRGQAAPYLVRGLPTVTEAEIVDIETLADIRLTLAERGLLGKSSNSRVGGHVRP